MERLGDALRATLERLAASGAVDDDSARQHAAYGEQMRREVEMSRRLESLRRAGALHAVTPNVRRAIERDTLDASTRAMAIAQRWHRNPDAPPCLAMQGGTGTGKSVAAAWLLAQRGGYLRSAQQVVRAFASRALDAVEEQESMIRCGLLVIDDLGTEHARDREWMTLALRELLEMRQASRTLISTNLTREQALARYADHRIASRAQRIAWLACDGEDMRIRKP